MPKQQHTAKDLFEALGEFDLCPTGVPFGPRPGPEELRKRWELPYEGRIWLNPLSSPQTVKWLQRLANHGNGIAVVRASTDTVWFHDLVLNQATAITFLKRRIRLHQDPVPGVQVTPVAACLAAYGRENADALHKATAERKTDGRTIAL